MRLDSAAIRLGTTVLLLTFACGPPEAPSNTGLRGQVLRGPIEPGPQPVGSPGDEPFSARFDVTKNGVAVTVFQSTVDGRFEVPLAPGDYVVVPDDSAPLLFPTQQQRPISVPREGYAEVTLRFDTGLR